jgi:hypothetical protein
MVHHARVDRWLAVLLVGLTLIEAGAGVAVLTAGLVGAIEPALGLGVGLALIVVGALFGLALWCCYHTRYEFTSTDLILRFGPIRSAVPLGAIVEVFPTRNPEKATAPALDRLQINYRGKGGEMTYALVSPQDKAGFVRDLAAAVPRLRSVGDEPLRLRADEPAAP